MDFSLYLRYLKSKENIYDIRFAAPWCAAPVGSSMLDVLPNLAQPDVIPALGSESHRGQHSWEMHRDVALM